MDLISNNYFNKVTSLIERPSFWDKYEVSRSPGDGHCLLHSIISSMYFQCEVQLMPANLVQAVVDVPLLNKHEFVTFLMVLSATSIVV